MAGWTDFPSSYYHPHLVGLHRLLRLGIKKQLIGFRPSLGCFQHSPLPLPFTKSSGSSRSYALRGRAGKSEKRNVHLCPEMLHHGSVSIPYTTLPVLQHLVLTSLDTSKMETLFWKDSSFSFSLAGHQPQTLTQTCELWLMFQALQLQMCCLHICSAS